MQNVTVPSKKPGASPPTVLHPVDFPMDLSGKPDCIQSIGELIPRLSRIAGAVDVAQDGFVHAAWVAEEISPAVNLVLPAKSSILKWLRVETGGFFG